MEENIDYQEIRKIISEEIHNYFCSNPGWFWGYNINRLSWFKAGMESVDYMLESLYNVYQSSDRLSHLVYTLTKLQKKGLIVEFGVGHKGESITTISENIKDGIVYGFDTFKGLPEQWGNVLPKGMFYNFGKPPKLNKDNIVFIKGLFNETLPLFIQEHSEDCAFINIDCDLYSSTNVVLSLLAERIVPGTIISFDEFFNYPGWKQNEFKAWNEFVEKYKVKYRYLSYVPSCTQLSLEILEKIS